MAGWVWARLPKLQSKGKFTPTLTQGFWSTPNAPGVPRICLSTLKYTEAPAGALMAESQLLLDKVMPSQDLSWLDSARTRSQGVA